MKKQGKALIRKLGFDIRRIQPNCELPTMEMPIIDVLALLIDNEVRAGDRPFVVQIGANDGSASDPISESIQRHSLEALLVEPQPDAYTKLAASYAAAVDRVKCVNALVSDSSGAVPFYTVKQTDGLPHWAYQSASLNRSVVSTALRMSGCSRLPLHSSKPRVLDSDGLGSFAYLAIAYRTTKTRSWEVQHP